MLRQQHWIGLAKPIGTATIFFRTIAPAAEWNDQQSARQDGGVDAILGASQRW